jgi:hypothetical protein
MVDDLAGPQRPGAFELRLRSGRRDHARAVQECDLDRRLADAAEAHRYLESSSQFGKVVLVV